jgi:dTDP-4-amino-4,6-dideoxygalactose transaminase
MRDSGIGVQVNYIPAYWHPVFEKLGHKRGECPVSDEFYGREISLPMSYALKDSEFSEVVNNLFEMFR